jgi:hypothetical protein
MDALDDRMNSNRVRLQQRFAGAVLASAGAAFVALAIYLLLFSTTADNQVATLPRAIVYGILPWLSGLACCAALLLKPERRTNAALIVIAAIFTVYAAEAAVFLEEIWAGLPSVAARRAHRRTLQRAKAAGVSLDQRSKLEVVHDLRRQDIDAYPTSHIPDLLRVNGRSALKSKISASGNEILPLGWISNTISVVCNESGHYLIYRSDEHGFNNPPDIWRAGHSDITVLGDSFAQGYCVPSGRNFVDIIRQKHPGIVNLGIAGAGPLSELAALKEYGTVVRSKIVLWSYYEGNDFDNLAAEKQSPLLLRYLRGGASQNLFGRQAETDRAIADYVLNEMNTRPMVRSAKEFIAALGPTESLPGKLMATVKLTRVRQKLERVFGDGRSDPRSVSPEELDLFRQILSDAKASVAQWGGKLYFVYLPAWLRYSESEAGDFGRAEVLGLLKSLDIPLIDIYPVFRIESDPLTLFPFRQAGHYNEKGHSLVASAITSMIPDLVSPSPEIFAGDSLE